MNAKLDQQLCEKYPEIFAYRHPPKGKKVKVLLPMYFGLECGDGWYNIIDCLCGVIENAHNNWGVITHAGQVKEKFGTLRFYADLSPDLKMVKISDDGKTITRTHRREWNDKTKKYVYRKLLGSGTDTRDGYEYVYGVIAMADLLSSKTCELCGRPGTLDAVCGWWSTLCPEHWVEYKKGRATPSATV